MKNLILILAFYLSASSSIAQTNKKFWSAIDESQVKAEGIRQIIPKKYKTYFLNAGDFKTVLFSAPLEKNSTLNNSTTVIELPMPDGTMQKFQIVEASIMSPELAAQFPEIKTFSAKGIDDQTAYGKLDWNEFGFHGMIRSTAGEVYIDPYTNQTKEYYISYYAADFEKDPQNVIPETAPIKKEEVKKKEKKDVAANVQAICAGNNLRTYRLAVACTHQYAVAATSLSAPTVAQTLAKVVTTVNRVDGIYETEVAVRLILISEEAKILYTDAATDRFQGNDDASILIDESQAVIDDSIGFANYDIGHTFSTGGGGLAYLGCVCSSNKASGITGSPYPVGDAYDVDYVAHEMGHQFDGDHTFTAQTGSCQGNGNTATRVEPGSGVTIMAYAGICSGNDVASHSIAYFHAISYDEITNFINTGNGNSCAAITSTGNNPPVVTGSVTYTIPKSTPFYLTGSATDPDGDSLSYQWEQIDVGPAANWNAGTKPYFRSYNPSASPKRLFPILNVAKSGLFNNTIGECLPSTAQTLNFRLTARDNKMGGGGVCSANSQVVVSNAGPFAITYPNVYGELWEINSTQTVTWNVNGTDAAPVSCANVNILLSLDAGLTFTMLVSNTPNDGSQVITVPNLANTVSICRIKVESIGNVFYDINDKNFIISTAVGIADLKSAVNTIGMQLNPNPSEGEVQISLFGLDKSEESNLIIYDVLGKIILRDEIKGKENFNQTYSLAELNAGMYFVEIVNSRQKGIARLIKQ